MNEASKKVIISAMRDNISAVEAELRATIAQAHILTNIVYADLPQYKKAQDALREYREAVISDIERKL